LLASVI